MLHRIPFPVAFVALVAPLLLAVTAPPARAQAWLPAKGEGAVSVLFSDIFSKYHFQRTTPVDRGHIRSDSLLVDVTYGLTDRVAVSLGIPWIAAKYTGPLPHPLVDTSGPIPVYYGVNSVDGGSYHGTFQDFRFDVRYNVTKRGMVLTPFIGTIVPSHDYAYCAHAATGRNLNEVQIGVSGARLLDRLVPGLFVQGSYSYGIPAKVLDISHNRSNVSLEVGYFATPKLRLLGLATGQHSHGGIDDTGTLRATKPELFFVHDKIQREHYLNLGGGVSYALSEKTDLFGSVVHAVKKRNGHAIYYGATVGVSWSFSTRSGARAIASAERSLAKCLCEKKSS